MAAKLQFKRGEAKAVTFALTAEGSPLSLVGATLFFGVKRAKSDPAYVIQKADSAFDKSGADQGQVGLFFTSNDLDQEPGLYVAELKVEFPDGTVDKSADLALLIEAAVT